MPIYEYHCEQHGTFEVLKSMRDYGTPEACPSCDLPGSRMLSSPNFACVSRSERIARDTNERASHSPRRGGKAQAQGCAHDHHHHHTQTKKAKGGLQAYKGKRPWVIEHG